MEKVKDRLLNVDQVRKILGCSRRHVYSLIEKGALPAFKIGRRQGIRVRESLVKKFLDECSMECGKKGGEPL